MTIAGNYLRFHFKHYTTIFFFEWEGGQTFFLFDELFQLSHACFTRFFDVMIASSIFTSPQHATKH